MKYPSARIVFYRILGMSLVLVAAYFLTPPISAEADLMCWNGASCTEGEEFVYCGLNPQVNCTQICGSRTPAACSLSQETTCANSWYQSCEYDARCGGAQCCHIYDCGDGTNINCSVNEGQSCGDVDRCECLPAVSYSWQYGSWSACSYSDSCDETSSKTRTVWCQSSTGAMVDDSYCDSGAKPPQSEVCATRVTAVDATLSGWSACNVPAGSCTGTQTRTCSGSLCGGSTTCGGANLSQNCPAPVIQGTLTNWSTCTAACGGGTCTETRSCVGASCGGNCNGASLTQTYTNNTPCGTCDDGNACTTDSGTYPNCTNTPVAPVQGTLTNWSTCTAACGGGTCTQTRSCVGASCGGNCNGASLTQTYTNNTPCAGTPDLTASAPSPTTATVNVARTFLAVVSNTGDASTNIGFTNLFQTSPSPTGASGVVDYPVTGMSALAAGGTANVSKSITFAAAGTIYVRACADKSSAANLGVVSESNEGNNCSAWTAVNVSAPVGNNASCVSVTAPSTVTAGQTFSATVVMENTGGTTWHPASVNPSNPYQLGSQNPQDNWIWGSSRAYLSVNSVAPGESATITINATAPSTIGTYPFEWKMVQELVEWFGAACAKTITVSPSSYPPGSFSLSAAPSCSYAGIPQIKLSWTNSTGATSYNVYRNSMLYAPNAVSDWVDSGVATGALYSYFVRALNGSDTTDSNSASQTGPNCAATGTYYDLSVIKSGQGTVIPDSAGGACTPARENCWSYLQDTWVGLTATPATGRIFTGWAGCDESTRNPDGSGGTCRVKMTGDRSVTANFAVDPDYREF